MDDFQTSTDDLSGQVREFPVQEEVSLAEVPGEVEAEAGQLLQEMQALRQDFETKVKYDESKERQIDRLYQELQVYREGLYFKILRPIFMDLIAVYDDLGKLVEGLPVSELEPAAAQMHENLRSFRESVEDILARNGVEPYHLEGDTYVPARQRVVQIIETTDLEQDKKIARRVRKGFAYDDRVLRPELIATYRAIPDQK